jgi:hypothetical protein
VGGIATKRLGRLGLTVSVMEIADEYKELCFTNKFVDNMKHSPGGPAGLAFRVFRAPQSFLKCRNLR